MTKNEIPPHNLNPESTPHAEGKISTTGKRVADIFYLPGVTPSAGENSSLPTLFTLEEFDEAQKKMEQAMTKPEIVLPILSEKTSEKPPSYLDILEQRQHEVDEADTIDEKIKLTAALLLYFIQELGICHDRNRKECFDMHTFWDENKDAYVKKISKRDFDLDGFITGWNGESDWHGKISSRTLLEEIAKCYYKSEIVQTIRDIYSDSGNRIQDLRMDPRIIAARTRFPQFSGTREEVEQLKTIFQKHYMKLERMKSIILRRKIKSIQNEVLYKEDVLPTSKSPQPKPLSNRIILANSFGEDITLFEGTTIIE